MAKHREHRRAQLSRWYFKNKERIASNYRKWQIANRKKRSEYNRKWLASKPGLAVAYARRWRKLNPEKIKQYRRESQLRRRDKIRAYMHDYAKRYYKKNRGRILEKTKAYSRSHPEIRRKCHRNWCKKYPDRARAHDKAGRTNRKARMRGADVSDTKINGLIRKWRMEHRFVCFYCKNTFSTDLLHVEHVVPIAKGGKHSVSNICKSCPRCNHSKSSKLVHQICINGQRLLI